MRQVTARRRRELLFTSQISRNVEEALKSYRLMLLRHACIWGGGGGGGRGEGSGVGREVGRIGGR